MEIIKGIVEGSLNKVSQQIVDNNSIYVVTDMPNNSITNAQMDDAISNAKIGSFYELNDTFVCLDEGTYTKNHIYRFLGLSWEDITAELLLPYDQYLERLQEIETSLDSERNSRISEDAIIQNWISTLNTDLTNEISERENVDNEITEKLNKDILKNIELTRDEQSPDALNITSTITNINSGNENVEIQTLPIANSGQSGLMSSSDVIAINELQTRVSGLENKTTRLLYTANENPTAQEINEFVISKGFTYPFEGIGVVINETYHIWHCYENDDTGWKDDGVDTVSKFTNELLGIVKGSLENGKIYAEADGTGSVNGWDTLVGQVSGALRNVEELQIELNTKITNPQSGQVGQVLTKTVNGEAWKDTAQDTQIDNVSINKNSNEEIQTIGVVHNNEIISSQAIYNSTHTEWGGA